jgi:hypothetical protein
MMAGASAAIFAIFTLTRKSWKQYMPIH